VISKQELLRLRGEWQLDVGGIEAGATLPGTADRHAARILILAFTDSEPLKTPSGRTTRRCV
jgi:hypothetical protein